MKFNDLFTTQLMWGAKSALSMTLTGPRTGIEVKHRYILSFQRENLAGKRQEVSGPGSELRTREFS